MSQSQVPSERRTIVSQIRAAPLPAAGVAIAVLLAIFVSAYPFTVVKYPHMGDLPMHASFTSILRHWSDPTWHFREQFTMEWLKSPYWTYWLLGALFNFVMPISAAMRLATVVCLLLLPAGLAVLFLGMKKSPLLGLLALSLSWTALTNWGFVNFIAAIGLFAMAIGATLLLLDAPSRARKWLLALVLVLVYATHVARYPFALLGVLGTTALLYPATRRFEEVLVSVAPSFALFAVWLAVREHELAPKLELVFHPERVREIWSVLGGGDKIAGQLAHATGLASAVLAVAAVSTLGFLVRRPWRDWTRREWLWHSGATAAVLSCAVGCLAMYLTLPMAVANWHYVYPREAVSAALLTLALVPDLPRSAAIRTLLLVLFGWATTNMTMFVAGHFTAFEHELADFISIKSSVPNAPRLAHVVVDPNGPHEAALARVHLAAWIQAEKGGWNSFHYAVWNQGPLRYRTGAGEVPPTLEPLRLTMGPEAFDLANRGKFYDAFLVYSETQPDSLFAEDPSIHRVAQAGAWWLYERGAAGRH